jgi:hypothetical protein
MLACWKTLLHVSPLRGSGFRWEPIPWGWHPRLLHATPPAFRTASAAEPEDEAATPQDATRLRKPATAWV